MRNDDANNAFTVAAAEEWAVVLSHIRVIVSSETIQGKYGRRNHS
jgi:hypothetical protein